MSTERKRYNEFLVYLGGLFVALLGLAVMIGWYSKTVILIQLAPNLPPMQFNTALALFLTGIGIILTCRYPNLAGVTGVLVMLLGGLTLAQYIFSVSFGIDELFVRSHIFFNKIHPGRPAPNTASCLLILGIILQLQCLFINFTFKNLSVAALSIFIMTLGLVAIIGYIFGVSSAYGWGQWTQMGLHSAVGILIAGLTIFYFNWFDFKSDDAAKRSILPITIVALGASLFLILWQFLIYNENNKVSAIVSEQGKNFSLDYIEMLDTHYLALSRMEKRQHDFMPSSLAAWKKDATQYLLGFASIDGLALYQPTQKIFEIVVRDQSAVDHLAECKQYVDARDASLEMHVLKNKNRLCIPFEIDSESGARSYLLSIINLELLLKQVAKQDSLGNYGMFVTHLTDLVYEQNNLGLNKFSQWSYQQKIKFHNLEFNIQIWPNEETVSSLSDKIPVISFLIGNLVTILLAITIWLLQKTKLNQRELIQSEHKARAANQQLQSIMNSSYLGIIAVNLDGIITEFNRSAERILGYRADEMIGRNSPAIFHDPDEIRKHAAYLSRKYGKYVPPGFQSFVGALAYTDVDESEWTYIKKDGTRVPVLLAVTALKSDDKVTGYMGIVMDITERKALEKMKNEFISVVSHELRTPLTSIHGSISLLVGNVLGKLSTEVTDLLKIALHNTERLIRLINDILDIEKIEAGKMNFQNEPLDLNHIIEESITSNQSFADKFSIALKFEKTLSNMIVNVDHDRLLQVLTNLISNAIKFSNKDGEVIIQTKLLEGNWVRTEVIDKGDGVPEEFQKRIFTKFSQADSSAVRGHAGTGLGLSIAKTIVERMEGSIGYTTKLHEGTVFYFDLPIHVEAETEPQPESKVLKEGILQVLYVEDDKDLSKVISTLLESFCEMTVVDSVKEAKHLAEQRTFDAVILDIVLKDGLGVELLPFFKVKKIPVVVFSAFDLPKEFATYANSFLVKSKTSHEEIISAVKEAVVEGVHDN